MHTQELGLYSRNMSMKKSLVLTLTALVLGAASVAASFYITPRATSQITEDSAQAIQEIEPVLSLEELYPHVIPSGSTLSSVLGDLNVTSAQIWEIVQASKPITDLGRLMPGTRFQLYYSEAVEPELVGIKFRFSALEMLDVRKHGDIWSAEQILETVESRVVTFTGVVTSSLWESAVEANMDPNLIVDLAEIFAWQVDFAREVRVNDRWRISVEQKLVKNEVIGWGNILAAEYENAGELHQAALFQIDEDRKGYFAPDGSSLKRMFLKSPIKYGRISSFFNRRRFHPILKVRRPHLGVDYAAPKGTPIRAVGSGTISFAGWSGGGGKVIKIRHNSVYKTAYKHLNGFAKGIRNGAKVQQGQIIGYVGSTGLSTGPHLHFEFFKMGSYVDPLRHEFPSADPVPADLLTQFQTEANSLLASLPEWGESPIEARSPSSSETL